jgi:hypothetical protein
MDLRSFNFSKKKYDAEQWEAKLKEYFEFMKTQTWIKYEAIKSGEMAGQLIPIPTPTPLTRKNLCIFAQISEETLRNYESNKEGYQNHFEVTTHALNIIDNNQIEGALVGAYNPNLVARLNGLSEKTENDNKNTNQNTNINFDNLSAEEIKDLLNENK